MASGHLGNRAEQYALLGLGDDEGVEPATLSCRAHRNRCAVAQRCTPDQQTAAADLTGEALRPAPWPLAWPCAAAARAAACCGFQSAEVGRSAATAYRRRKGSRWGTADPTSRRTTSCGAIHPGDLPKPAGVREARCHGHPAVRGSCPALPGVPDCAAPRTPPRRPWTGSCYTADTRRGRTHASNAPDAAGLFWKPRGVHCDARTERPSRRLTRAGSR